jgi:L-threonylcarbamoyladenylate synthase
LTVSQKVVFALLYIRADAFESPQVPDFPFMVMYRTMNGKRVDDFLRVHQMSCFRDEMFSLRFWISYMPARILKTDTQDTLRSAIQEAAKVILSGGVVAVPTESFYGLAVHALDERAVERLFAAKGRREDKPVLILIASIQTLDSYVKEVSDKARKIIERFWPGGLTLVFRARPNLPDLLTAGTGKIGVRLSGHAVPRELARAVGAPITGTSANRSGQPSCSTAQEVMVAVGEEIGLILNGGRTSGGKGSTVLDVTVNPPAVLRDGIVSRDELRPFLD